MSDKQILYYETLRTLGAVLFTALLAGGGLFWAFALDGEQRRDIRKILREGHVAVKVNDAQRQDVQNILSGSYVAVEAAEFERLKRQELQELAETAPVVDRERFEQYRQEELRQLAGLQQKLRRERDAIEKDHAALETERAAFEKKRRTAAGAPLTRKLRKLYQSMDADDLAADLAVLLREGEQLVQAGQRQEGQDKIDQVVLIVDQLPERFAAEVLSELRDPAQRSQILARLRQREGLGNDR